MINFTIFFSATGKVIKASEILAVLERYTGIHKILNRGLSQEHISKNKIYIYYFYMTIQISQT